MKVEIIYVVRGYNDPLQLNTKLAIAGVPYCEAAITRDAELIQVIAPGSVCLAIQFVRNIILISRFR